MSPEQRLVEERKAFTDKERKAKTVAHSEWAYTVRLGMVLLLVAWIVYLLQVYGG